jgi:hypothetical protein
LHVRDFPAFADRVLAHAALAGRALARPLLDRPPLHVFSSAA